MDYCFRVLDHKRKRDVKSSINYSPEIETMLTIWKSWSSSSNWIRWRDVEFLKDQTLCRHLCHRTSSTQQIATLLTFFIPCSITQQSLVEHLTWTSLSCPMTQNVPKCKIESTHRGTFNLLNSIFVWFSIPTGEHLRELKFIFFFELNIFSTLLKLNIQHSYYWVQAITITTFVCS